MSDQQSAIRKEVLALFRNEGKRSFRQKEVAKRLGYFANEEYRLCRQAVEELTKTGKIQRVKGNQFTLRPTAGKLEGKLSVHPKGYGFVSVEGHADDYYVKARRLGTALDGDTVRIAVGVRKPGDERREAEVMEVLKRGRTTAVGTFKHSGSFATVTPDDKSLTHDIYVDIETLGEAVSGDKMQVSIDAFEHRGGAPSGRILKVLGVRR